MAGSLILGRRGALAALSMLTACATGSGAAPPAEGPPVVAVASSPHETVPDASVATATPCVLHDDGFEPVEHGVLRFTPKHAAFVEVVAGKIRAVLDPNAGTLRAEVTFDGVTLRGAGKPRDIAVHATKPVLFGGIAIPFSESALRWTGGQKGGALHVVHELETGRDESVELARVMRCADVALSPATYVIDEPTEGAAEIGYVVADEIELAASFDGAVVARVEVEGGVAEVAVLERRGERARIAWMRSREQIMAWVDMREVSPNGPSEIGEAFGVGGLGLYGVGTSGPGRIVCRERVDLFATVGGERRVVGSVEPGTELEASVVRDGHREIQLDVTHHKAFRSVADTPFSIRSDVQSSSCEWAAP